MTSKPLYGTIIIALGISGIFIGKCWASKGGESVTAISESYLNDALFVEANMRICKVIGCNCKHSAKGLCHKHYNQQYRKTHNDKMLAYKLKYRIKNKDKIGEYKYRYRRKNKLTISKYNKEYRKRNPFVYYRGKCKRRLWLSGYKTEGLAHHTEAEWRKLKKRYNYTCFKCGKKEPEIRLSRDHILPISLGGDNTIQNIQPLCTSCNTSKFTRAMLYNKKEVGQFLLTF